MYVGVRVSASALFLTPESGGLRVVPRPVCKTGARLSNGGPIPPSPTLLCSLDASVAQLARANGSYPCGFIKGSTPGGGTSLVLPVGNALPTCLAFIQETSRPQVRHGRPFAGVAEQVDAPRSDRAAFSQGALQVRILPPTPLFKSS